MNTLNTINNFNNTEKCRAIDLLNVFEETNKLIYLLESICVQENRWHLTNESSFKKIFTKIEDINRNNQLNVSQLRRIITVIDYIYHSIKNPELINEINQFLSETKKQAKQNEIDKLAKQAKVNLIQINENLVIEIIEQTDFSRISELTEKLSTDCPNFSIKLNLPTSTQWNETEFVNTVKKYGHFVVALTATKLCDQFISEQTIQHIIKSCPKIQELSLTSDSVTLESLQDLESLSQLNKLSLIYCQNLSSLPPLPSNLQYLNVSVCNHLEFLPSCPPNLETLIAAYCGKLASLPFLSKTLKLLDLTDCQKLKGINWFPETLQTLRIRNCTKISRLPDFPDSLQCINAIDVKIDGSFDTLERLLQEGDTKNLHCNLKSFIAELRTQCRQVFNDKNLSQIQILHKKIELIISKHQVALESFKSMLVQNEYQGIEQEIMKLYHHMCCAIAHLREKQKEETKYKRGQEDVNQGYVDSYRLLQGARGQKKIKTNHWNWFLSQSILHEQAQKLDPVQQRELYRLMLQSYLKAAPFHKEGLQTTPLKSAKDYYYRLGDFSILSQCNQAYAAKLGITYPMHLVASSLLQEAFQRHGSLLGIDIKIDSQEKLNRVIDELLDGIKQNKLQKAEDFFLDLTDYIAANNIPASKIEDVADYFENMIRDKIELLEKSTPGALRNLQFYKDHIKFIAFTRFENQDILLLPDFDLESDSTNIVGQMIEATGFYPSPSQLLEAWLKVEDVSTILNKRGITLTKLATSGSQIPTVCPTISDFIKKERVQWLHDLASEAGVPPYVSVLAKATVSLLQGLAEFDIDAIYKEKGLSDLLQFSYERMLNACGDAVLRHADFTEFYNQLEVIHHEIQSILAIASPYKSDALAKTVIAKFRSGTNPVMPKDLDDPKVHLKGSGLHMLASILSSVESQKGTNALNVMVLKDSYFESADLVNSVRTYNCCQLDGDAYRARGIKNSLNPVPKQPIDLFLCEFNHNIATKRQHYLPEDIASQVEKLHKEGLLADTCTVVIDNTLDFEQSDKVRNFLANPVIKDLIQGGKLNVVLMRSAQKFDMLGFDNYYGGIASTFNHAGKFDKFNERMDHPQDQLDDINYQGLTHLQKYGNIDAYRKAIQENTKKLYGKLPTILIAKPGQQPGTIEIAKMEDESLFFLDIRFKHSGKSLDAFLTYFKRFATQRHLPITYRSSFGFATANMTLTEICRFTVGLENESTLDRYAEFFKVISKLIDQNPNLTDDELAIKIDNLW